MKTSPIIFSTPMVQAILDGRKKQTRRIIKSQPDEDGISRHTVKNQWEDTSGKIYKPKYQTGDILWVRETWMHAPNFPEWGGDEFYFKASKSKQFLEEWPKSWKPSIHMPKKAARIFLNVIKVRIEPLQDISEEDAIAEGIEGTKNDGFKVYGKYGGRSCAQVAFESLWISINGIDSYKSNPFVWVFDFEIIKKPENFI